MQEAKAQKELEKQQELDRIRRQKDLQARNMAAAACDMRHAACNIQQRATYSVQCATYIVQHAAYSMQRATYSVRCAMHNVQRHATHADVARGTGRRLRQPQPLACAFGFAQCPASHRRARLSPRGPARCCALRSIPSRPLGAPLRSFAQEAKRKADEADAVRAREQREREKVTALVRPRVVVRLPTGLHAGLSPRRRFRAERARVCLALV